MTTPRTMIRDAAVMRALAHPARLALLDHLGQHPDGATATQCATVVELSPSATSYHLRALAKVGLIQQAPGRGDGRERVWQATQRSLEFASDRDASPEQAAAEQALVEAFLANQDAIVRRHFAVSRAEPPQWYDATTISSRTLLVTAEELTDLVGRVQELIEAYAAQERADPPPGSRRVSFQVRAVPTEPAGQPASSTA